MIWIRFEQYRRFHAVYAETLGVRFTWCGRTCRVGGERAKSLEPGVQCRGCQTRIKHPYLIPEELTRCLRSYERRERELAARPAHPRQMGLGL